MSQSASIDRLVGGLAALRTSLRARLLALTLAGLAVALTLSGWALTGLFRQHVERQAEAMLRLQLDQLTARLDADATGAPVLDASALADPRWSRPYAGLYWQLDTPTRHGVLRSRSLWDATLQLPADAADATAADGAVHRHVIAGPREAELLVLERTVVADGADDTAAAPRWRLIVAADRAETAAALRPFVGALAASLGVLGLLLALAAVGQVAVGLAPLRGLQRALAALRAGQATRLVEASPKQPFPAEVLPLIDDFNHVLDRQEQGVARARSQAGNLAHAVKTPLAALALLADELRADDRPTDLPQADAHGPAAGLDPARRAALARDIAEQVATARRQVDWHLARARTAALGRQPGLRTPVAPLLDALVRVLARVHAARELQIDWDAADELAFLGEAQDLQELLGNLVDNACKWARRRVVIEASAVDGRLQLSVDDDGPGLDAAQRQAVLERGVRADEQVPGHGLGLAIVRETVTLYGGTLALEPSRLGGLRVGVTLPGELTGPR